MRLATALVPGLAATAALAGGALAQTPGEGEQAAPACDLKVPKLSRPPGEGAKMPGNGHVWGWIPRDGRLVARPRDQQGLPRLNSDGSITTKVLWLVRLSERTRKRTLTVTGRQLDGEGEFRVGPRRGGWNGEALYYPGYLTFSEPGCWKIAATAGRGTRLVAVISVEPPPEEDPKTRR